MIQAGSGEAIPATRDQALLMLEAADWDPDRLTPEQREAIIRLYGLAEYSAIADDLEAGTSCRCTSGSCRCTEGCRCSEHPTGPDAGTVPE